MKSILKFSIKVALAVTLFSAFAPKAEAMRWTPGDGCYVIDCRNGWYCTTCNGLLDIESTWSMIYSQYFQ